MHIASLVQLSATPNITSLIGAQGSKRVIDSINATGGGVYFGSNVDPFANNYQNFRNIYTNALNVQDELRQSQFYVVGMNEVIPITCAEHLVAVPPVMQEPILTYAPVRHYYNAGVLEGWGIEIPEEVEDVTGRVINSGLIEPHFNDDGKYVMPDEIVWEEHYEDPEYTEDELNALDDTRRFFAQYIKEQIGPGKDRRDPTSHDGGTIGKLK